MTARSRTKQEQFWAGAFGDDYVARNRDPALLASKLALFSRILARASRIESVVELGANIGLNLRALRQLLPDAKLHGVEINAHAAGILREWGECSVDCRSLFDFEAEVPADLAFTSGVLIHVAPEMLPRAYEVLYASSRRYVLVSEYYNPTPVEVPYRGHTERLFKRDFAGELMDRFDDLRLIDYGFVYRRDPRWPADDLTWFLLEKRPRG